MDDLTAREYAALRDTIRTRGTARLHAALAGLVAWAALLVAVLAWLPVPLASVVPLVVLLASFEVVRAYHLGVERIGRYIQAFFEESPRGSAPTRPPAWEHTAMRMGPTVPGAGVHPYFLPVFFVATLVNFLAVLLPGPLALELGTLAVPHVAFLVWLTVTDRRMRAQRRTELEQFRAFARHDGAAAASPDGAPAGPARV